MKRASLTNHAKQRLGERCSLSEAEIRQFLDAGAGIPIHLQKGGRYVHRLIYSPKDEDWFMVVQDGGDGGVLTVMPLSFLEGRTEVTAAQKRQARSRAITAHRSIEQTPPGSDARKTKPPPDSQQPPLPGWKIHVRYSAGGKIVNKNLGRTLEEHGHPKDWMTPGLVHDWFKGRLNETKISIIAIRCIMAERKGNMERVDQLLEHLPLTREELEGFR